MLCGSGYYVHGYQVKRNAGALLVQADRAEKDGNLAKAADYFSRYLSLVPADPDALARFGLLLSDPKVAKTGRDSMRALSVLERAVLRDPNRNDLRRRVVRMAMELRRYTNARDDIDRLLKAFPDDGELEAMSGFCFEQLGKFEDARKQYEKAIKHAPTTIDNYRHLASLLRRHTTEVLGKNEKNKSAAEVLQQADKLIDDMVQTNEKSYRAHLVRADYLRQFLAPNDPKETEKADRDIARAVELEPDAADVIMAASSMNMFNKNIEQARDLLKRGCELHPTDARLFQQLAFLEQDQKQSEAAINALRLGLSKLRDHPDLLWQLAEVLTQSGRNQECEEVLDRLEKIGIPDADRSCLRAKLKMHERSWLEAIRLLENAIPVLSARAGSAEGSFAAVLAQNAGSDLGYCCAQVGDYDRARAAYHRVVARNPRFLTGRLALAGMLGALGRYSEALDQYQQVMRLPVPPEGVKIEIARLLLLRTLERDESRRDWSEVDIALKRAEDLRPVLVQTVVLRTEMLAAQKKNPNRFADAKSHVLKQYPEPPSRPLEAWTILAALDDRAGDIDSALSLLKTAGEYLKDSVDLQLAQARILGRKGGPNMSSALSQIAECAERLSGEDRPRLLFGLATIAMQAGDSTLAGRWLERVAKERPNDLPCRVVLFDIAAQGDNASAMEKYIDDIQRIEGNDGALWRYARASYLIGKAANEKDKGKTGLHEARLLLADAAVRRSSWTRLILCQARLDDVDNKPDAALAGYQRALQEGDRDIVALRRAVELLYARHRYAEALSLIQRQPEPALLPAELRRIGAELALNNDHVLALRLAEGTVVSGSEDYRDHLWLGRVYLTTGKREEAGKAFERARQLSADAPDTLVALVQYLTITGQKERALIETEAASERLTGDSARLALAHCYESMGLIDRAKKHLDAALKANAADAETLRSAVAFYMRTRQFDQADQVLKELTAPGQKLKAPEIEKWARRTRALVLALKGGSARTAEALALLNDSDSAAGPIEVASLKRIRATILAMQNTKESRQSAVAILESLIERREETVEDHYLAAQLHEALRNWTQARRRYLSMMDLPGSDTPEHLARCARFLISHGFAGDAGVHVEKIESRDPKSFVAHELKARLLHADGNSAQARALIQSYAKTEGALLMPAAILLTDFKAFDDAEALIRRNAEATGKPLDTLVLAQFFVDRGRFVEAIETCDRIWADVPPLEVANVALSALAEIRGAGALFERVERRLHESMKKAPDIAGLVAALAAVRNFQGRFDESEQLYRRTLEMDPKQITALNNLAWLLALRGERAAEAMELLNRAAQITGIDAGLLDTRGVARLATKSGNDVELAIKDLESASAESPGPAVYFHLAQAYLAANRRERALEAWKRAKLHGVSADVLHPLERAAFNQLAGDLK